MKTRDLIKTIEKDGWLHVRTRGSHRQYKHPLKPGPPYRATQVTTRILIPLKSVLVQAGLKGKP
jgi:hypothetical protein